MDGWMDVIVVAWLHQYMAFVARVLINVFQRAQPKVKPEGIH